ncbi:hypothetical protein JXA32_16510 [Candidatus Sumerlaeota bacterium]|nr:hypothetical protein [Candidatus Sumerlaeota bacterium]
MESQIWQLHDQKRAGYVTEVRYDAEQDALIREMIDDKGNSVIGSARFKTGPSAREFMERLIENGPDSGWEKAKKSQSLTPEFDASKKKNSSREIKINPAGEGQPAKRKYKKRKTAAAQQQMPEAKTAPIAKAAAGQIHGMIDNLRTYRDNIDQAINSLEALL